MKKLYTLLAAAALVFSASAAEPNFQYKKLDKSNVSDQITKSHSMTLANEDLKAKPADFKSIRKAPAKASSEQLVIPMISDMYGIFMSGQKSPGFLTISESYYVLDAANKKVTIYGFYDPYCDVEGEYDPETNEISVQLPIEYSRPVKNEDGTTSEVDCVIYFLESGAQTTSQVTLSGVYSPEDRIVELDCPVDKDDYYIGSFNSGMYTENGISPIRNFQALGYLSYEYNSIQQFSYTYNGNEYTDQGYIYMTQDYPNIKISNIGSGFFIGNFYTQFYTTEMVVDLENMTASVADAELAYVSTTEYYTFWDKNGTDSVLNFTLVEKTDAETGEIYYYAVCDENPFIVGMYSNGELEGDEYGDYVILIPFDVKVDGVKNVTVDNSNAPVEYYNLQGVRVQNPENGIFIRRQGTQATKVIK